MPDGDFFFDFVRHLTDWIKKARHMKDGKNKKMALVFVVTDLSCLAVPHLNVFRCSSFTDVSGVLHEEALDKHCARKRFHG